MTVNNIDPFEGGMAEDHVPGSDMGPLFTTIIADQFNRLRAGDRYFYLNESWNPDELRIMQQGKTLGEVIEANTGITNLQSDVFKFKASIAGSVVSKGSGRDSLASSSRGLSGVTVNLVDTSGNVLATTVTDSWGSYSFNQLDGVGGTGEFTVRLVVPSGFSQISNNPSTILISRGDIHVSGVDFAVATSYGQHRRSQGSAGFQNLAEVKSSAEQGESKARPRGRPSRVLPVQTRTIAPGEKLARIHFGSLKTSGSTLSRTLNSVSS